MVPSGCGRGVRLHQPPPCLETPPGQRLHHTHPLHHHEGSPERHLKHLMILMNWCLVSLINVFLLVSSSGCPLWPPPCLFHVGPSCQFSLSVNKFQFSIGFSCSGKISLENNVLLYLCVMDRCSIWQTCWRDHGSHVPWGHTCCRKCVSHSSWWLCCRWWVLLTLFLYTGLYFLILITNFQATFQFSSLLHDWNHCYCKAATIFFHFIPAYKMWLMKIDSTYVEQYFLDWSKIENRSLQNCHCHESLVSTTGWC